MGKFIAARHDGELIVHAASRLGGYDTLCGCDLNDPGVGVFTAEVPLGARITCRQCRIIFDEARKFRVSEFAC